MNKVSLITTDDSGSFLLRGNLQPAAPIFPGADFKHTLHLQHGPVVFTRLHLGPCPGVFTLGPDTLSPIGPNGSTWDASAWRVDEVTIDDALVDLRQTPCGFGSRSSLRVTNVGEVPAHFYAYWECGDVQ